MPQETKQQKPDRKAEQDRSKAAVTPSSAAAPAAKATASATNSRLGVVASTVGTVKSSGTTTASAPTVKNAWFDKPAVATAPAQQSAPLPLSGATAAASTPAASKPTAVTPLALQSSGPAATASTTTVKNAWGVVPPSSGTFASPFSLTIPAPTAESKGAIIRIIVDLVNLTASLGGELSTVTESIAWLLGAVPNLLQEKGVVDIDPEALDTLVVDSQPDDQARHDLHVSLEAQGFKVHVVPRIVGVHKKVQKGVDIKIAVELLRLCGGLRTIGDDGAEYMRKQQHVVLVSADADFKPAIEALLKTVPNAKVWVIGHTNCIGGRDYVDWLQRHDRKLTFVHLDELRHKVNGSTGPVERAAA